MKERMISIDLIADAIVEFACHSPSEGARWVMGHFSACIFDKIKKHHPDFSQEEVILEIGNRINDHDCEHHGEY